MVKEAGVPLCDAVKMMTATPAEIIGKSASKGTVAKGFDADLVLFDHAINIKLTMIDGRVIYKSD